MWKSITLHFYGVFLVFDRVLLKLCTWSKTQSIMGHIWYQCWAHVSVERIWRTDILGAWCISPLCSWTLLDLSSSVFALRVEQLIDMNAQWGADGLMLENNAAAVARPWTGCCSLSLLPADLLSSLFLFQWSLLFVSGVFEYQHWAFLLLPLWVKRLSSNATITSAPRAVQRHSYLTPTESLDQGSPVPVHESRCPCRF